MSSTSVTVVALYVLNVTGVKQTQILVTTLFYSPVYTGHPSILSKDLGKANCVKSHFDELDCDQNQLELAYQWSPEPCSSICTFIV